MAAMLGQQGLHVTKDRVISKMPQCYRPESSIQYKSQFNQQVKNACKQRHAVDLGLKMSKVVMLGDLYVGKTSLINRFCKNVFDRDYKATIGVDFEIEKFEILGIPFNLQIWDTAGQEKFKCIASTYYRGAQVIITAFDLGAIQTLENTKRWVQDALRENDPEACSIFLVGTKKDTVTLAECERTERDAIQFATEFKAEYWSVSAKTGEHVKDFFFRVAALAFEQSMMSQLERSKDSPTQIGNGTLINLEGNSAEKKENESQHACC